VRAKEKIKNQMERKRRDGNREGKKNRQVRRKRKKDRGKEREVVGKESIRETMSLREMQRYIGRYLY
jgi:hypothetical protein